MPGPRLRADRLVGVTDVDRWADLAPEYPRFADFLALRDRLDPDRLFSNPYLDRVLGP